MDVFLNRPDKQPPTPEEFNDSGILAFHRSLQEYKQTPLRSCPAIARKLGIKELWVKDESGRFGLGAFKGLGASYALHKLNLPAGSTVTTATAGNHGMGVAWAARQLGHSSEIFLPSSVSKARAQRIERAGARVHIVEGSYDDSVKRCEQEAQAHGWHVIQDTAWEGYTRIPALIMAGYTTSWREVEGAFDAVFLQAGVGSWAAAIAWCLRENSARIACVEPAGYAGLLESARKGQLTAIQGRGETIMGCLGCETPSSIAWPILAHTADLFVGVEDSYAREAMRDLHACGIVSGPSGAGGLAGALALVREGSPEARAHLGLCADSRVLVFSTEGANDKELYESIIQGS